MCSMHKFFQVFICVAISVAMIFLSHVSNEICAMKLLDLVVISYVALLCSLVLGTLLVICVFIYSYNFNFYTYD